MGFNQTDFTKSPKPAVFDGSDKTHYPQCFKNRHSTAVRALAGLTLGNIKQDRGHELTPTHTHTHLTLKAQVHPITSFTHKHIPLEMNFKLTNMQA